MSDIFLAEGINELNVRLVPIYVPPPTGNLYGVITDAVTGELITRSVRVAIYENSRHVTDRIFVGGSYSFSIPTGTYNIWATASGYSSRWYRDVAVGVGTELNIELMPR